MDHQDHDKRSLDIHRFLMCRLQEQPHRLADLQAQWDYWLGLKNFSCAPRYVEAWQTAIQQGVDAVVSLATDETDWGQAIRQCSPAGVLWGSPQERWKFMKQWNAEKLNSTAST